MDEQPHAPTYRMAAPRAISLRNRLVAAIALAAVIPTLVLALVVHRYALPVAGERDIPLSVLALATTVAMATGGSLLWDIARRVSRVADLAARWQPRGVIRSRDELSRLADYVSDVVTTERDQSHTIESLHLRLVAVQNELDMAREKLRTSPTLPARWDILTPRLDPLTRPARAARQLVAS